MAEKINKYLDDFSELESEKQHTKEDLAGVANEVLDNFRSRLRTDHGVTFYTVQPGDTILSIHNKLKEMPGYEYLKQEIYNPLKSENKIRGWNIPDKYLQAGIEIPIPMSLENRVLKVKSYPQVAINSIQNLEVNEQYMDLAKELSSLTPEYLGKLALAFSDKESDGGLTALFRREQGHKSFSYTVYHFLFNTRSPFKTAMDRLGYTKGEIMSDYTKATTVFFAGLYEKAKSYLIAAKHKDAKKFTKDNFSGGFAHFLREENIMNVAHWYNGLNEQGKRYAQDFVAGYDTLKVESYQTDPGTLEVPVVSRQEETVDKAIPTRNSDKFIDLRDVDDPSFAKRGEYTGSLDENEEIEYEIDFKEIGRSKDNNYAVYKVKFDVGTWYLAPGEIESMFAGMYNVDQKLVRLTDAQGQETDFQGGIPSKDTDPQRQDIYIKYLDVVTDYAEQLRENESTFVRLYSYPSANGNEITVYGFKPDVWFENMFSGNNWTVHEIKEEFQSRLKEKTGKMIPLSRIKASEILGREDYRDEQVILDKADEEMDQFDVDINKVFLHVEGAYELEQLK